MSTRQEALQVACPRCSAAAGEPCLKLIGPHAMTQVMHKPYPMKSIHQDRYRLAEQKSAAVQYRVVRVENGKRYHTGFTTYDNIEAARKAVKGLVRNGEDLSSLRIESRTMTPWTVVESTP